MQGKTRKVVYLGLYEAIAIVMAGTGLSLMSGQGALQSGALAVVTSAIAVVWNLTFNHLFERWE
ncbi:MAG: chlorhexidine efflux transporter, partial [Rhizobacter sp.]